MPRNGSGVASKPAGTTAVPNTQIESSKYNSTIDDIYALLNDALPIVAGGTGATSAASARTNLGVPGLSADNTMSGANTFTGINTYTKIVKWAKGADVASASTLTLGDDGNYFDITGTTTITAIATKGAGTVVKLHFDASLTLTHHATDLVLPGGANITTAAGDEAEFVEYATGDWRCTNYQKASISPTKPCFNANKNNVNQTGIVSATETKLTFGTEVFDVGEYYDAANSRWTPPAGPVCLNAVCQAAGTLSATAQLVYLVIYKNGAAFAYGPSVRGANTGNSAASVTATDIANGTDYYEVFVNIATSSGTGTVTGTVSANRFEGFCL